jgi:hypothetical protein
MLALGAVTAQITRPARRADLGWLGYSGCGQQAASAVWPSAIGCALNVKPMGAAGCRPNVKPSIVQPF